MFKEKIDVDYLKLKKINLERKLTDIEKTIEHQINELKNRHIEDIRGQQLAYNIHLDTIRADHERALALEIEKQHIQNQSNLGDNKYFLKIFSRLFYF